MMSLYRWTSFLRVEITTLLFQYSNFDFDFPFVFFNFELKYSALNKIINLLTNPHRLLTHSNSLSPVASCGPH